MTNRKILKANLEGRDYVIGDLHGAYSAFENLLKNLNFDKSKDRIISVGDLVDRGPDSYSCLQLLDEPWFHCVKSNHEEMMVSAFYGGSVGRYWVRNGGHWGQTLLDQHLPLEEFEETEFGKLVLKAKNLPYIISVETKSGEQVHVVHAEFPKEVVITDEALNDPEFVNDIVSIQNYEGSKLLWDRFTFLDFFRFPLHNIKKIARKVHARVSRYNIPIFTPNLSHVISGHTMVQRPLTIGSMTCIDTAAYDSYKGVVNRKLKRVSNWCALTALDINAWEFFQATEDKFRQVQPLVINTIVIDTYK